MDGYDIVNVLDSFEILTDTREQPTDKSKRRYDDFECPYERCTLSYGDYTYNATLPGGNKIFDTTQTVKGHAIVERKMDLVELSNCLCQHRARFEAEFKRAKENNTSIYLLVEDASWENLINGKYKTKFNPKSYFASITAFMVRYNIKPIFCKSETSGKIIKQVLYRELKERRESGSYD